MALTELQVKNFKPKAKLYRVSDGGGLALEVSPTGSRLWRWRYTFQGKEQMLSLGKYPLVTLAEARKRRDAAKLELDEGKNPSREKKIRKIRNAHKGENTFENVTRRWIDLKGENLNPRYKKQSLARMEQYVFPRIGDLPIADITIPDVVSVVESVGKRGTLEIANRVKQLMKQVFRYAAQRGLCEHNPAADLRDILPARREEHHACIPIAELPDLLKAIESQSSDLGKYAMQLLMLTFVRTGELIKAQWDEINWAKEEWLIPAERMKMKRPHVVPLSRQSLAILHELEKLTGSHSHIFYSAASKSKHISNGIILMALRRMGYKGRMTGHGFRTLASTILNEKGYPPDVIERQLAHEDSDKIRAAYNRAEYLLERKKMMQEYADWLDVVAAQKPDKVLEMEQKSAS